MARRAGVGTRGDDLHRRGLQGHGEDHLRAGAKLEDPKGLFNASLEGNTRRAIDFHEGEAIDARAFKALVKAAVKFNAAKKR